MPEAKLSNGSERRKSLIRFAWPLKSMREPPPLPSQHPRFSSIPSEILLQPRETARCPPSPSRHSLCSSAFHRLPPFPGMPSSSTPTEISPCFPSKSVPKSYLLQEDALLLPNPSHLSIQIYLLLSLGYGGGGKRAEGVF